jgi:glycerophosphoryl diester phosphodiesterase
MNMNMLMLSSEERERERGGSGDVESPASATQVRRREGRTDPSSSLHETENLLLGHSSSSATHHESFHLANTDEDDDHATRERRGSGGWLKVRGHGAGLCLLLSFVAALVGLVLLSQGFTFSTTTADGVFDQGAKSYPLIIGHRGSCGMLPEHTIKGYELAIKQGADCIECDVILTKDGVPICRHDLTLDSTTDVASRSEFASKKTTRMVEGEEVTGFFAVDFLLSEIKQLGAVQRMDFRDPNYNGLFEVATLQEQIDLVKNNNEQEKEKKTNDSSSSVYSKHTKVLGLFLGFGKEENTTSSSSSSRKICLYPEMKSTTWHNSLHMWEGRRSEDIILDTLERNGYRSKDDNIYLQSFETLDLEYVHRKTDMKLIQLIGGPDEIQVDTKRPYSDLMTKKGIETISHYAFAVSPSKNDIMPKNETTGYIDQSAIQHGKEFVGMIHSSGLEVHPWVLRDENRYLAWNYGQDVYNEYTAFVRDIGVDGFFTDFPKTASNYLRYFPPPSQE